MNRFSVFILILSLIIIPLLIIISIYYWSFFVFSSLESIQINNSSSDSLIPKIPEPEIYEEDEEEEKPVYLALLDDKKQEFITEGKDFLEVNLDAMKIRLYQEGELEKEVSILAKGDPQEWGGSAAGLYQILDGHKVSFSVAAGVYMPYALHYYGKYYLHGEPYYSRGGKLISSVSGGCIRLNDEDAKTVYELTEIKMPFLVIDKMRDGYIYSKIKKEEENNDDENNLSELSAQSYLVADLDSGFVFAERDSREQLPIASLTKLMTAIVVAENIDLRRSILVREEMLTAYGSTKGLTENKRFRVVELFYPLLTESSNDAAEVLSYFLGKEKTIELMNEKAKAILMEETRFVDPSGFEPENIGTAQNLFYLARYILNNRPPILDITKGEKAPSFGKVYFDIKDLQNKNIFISDPTFVGGKTGFIKTSKYTALFIFRLKTRAEVERNIVIILLGSEDAKTDTQKIYKWLQQNYFKP